MEGSVIVLVVHGTKKLRDRVGLPVAPAGGDVEAGILGRWYATAVFWRPQVALFVHESTLLPVFVPLAPAAGLLERFPTGLAEMLQAHGVPDAWANRQLATMGDRCLVPTANRRVVGVMNEFLRMAGFWRADHPDDGLVELAMWLGHVPCSPLYDSHVSPDHALAALVAASP